MDSAPIPFLLPAKWRERADYLRAFGDPACARLWELAASELDAALAAQGDETLTLVEAAKVPTQTAAKLAAVLRRAHL